MTADRTRTTPTGDRIRQSHTPSGPTGPSQLRVSYPHRVTLDLDDDRYNFVKQLAWQDRTTLSELFRHLIDTRRSVDPPPTTDQP